MNVMRRLLRGTAALAVAATVVAPAGATSLERASLDELTTTNSTILVGEVLDAHSYWNREGNFILTDVVVAAKQVLKGRVDGPELTVTLMGGSVGETTTLILGGAELAPGRRYVLFLNEEDLPGVQGVRTVRDHVQGAFEIVKGRDGVRAVSQASRHPLAPDAAGLVEAPGGTDGLSLPGMIGSIRETLGREAGSQGRGR